MLPERSSYLFAGPWVRKSSHSGAAIRKSRLTLIRGHKHVSSSKVSLLQKHEYSWEDYTLSFIEDMVLHAYQQHDQPDCSHQQS